MTIKSIPLSKLVPSAANVRKTNATIGIEELAASIKAHGLLQNLQVQKAATAHLRSSPEDAALPRSKLAKKKTMAKDAPVNCNVLSDDNATEISLAENEMREAMHPADQFKAFKTLIDAGHGPEEVAARFGVTAKIVQQRLRLATVSKKLFALYRKGEMNLDQLMAFTVSDNHAEQEGAWFEAADWNRSAHAIRQRLTAAHVADSDRRVPFVTVDAYVAAGGSIITDLFQTKRCLADPALLDRLAHEKLEREAEAVRNEGWSWVEIMGEIDWEKLRGYEELRGKRQPLPPKDAKKLAKLQREREAFSEDGEYTDDELDRCEQLNAEITACAEGDG